MIKRWIEEFKSKHDCKQMHKINYLLVRFYSDERRKDFILRTFFRIKWTEEELDDLSNLLGREAHALGREKL